MKLPELIRHPISTARMEPRGMGMVTLGATGTVMNVVDRLIGSDLSVTESLALEATFAASAALGGLRISITRRQPGEASSPVDYSPASGQ